MSIELTLRWNDLKMCEHYLNNYKGKTNKQYYTRLRRSTLKAILKLQLREFDKS